MIKIYADLHKDEKYVYIEDIVSSHDLSRLTKDELKNFILNFIQVNSEIHTCYSRFVNVVARYIRDCGPRWCGQEFIVYTTEFAPYGIELKKKVKHKYNPEGRLLNWTIGYFGD